MDTRIYHSFADYAEGEFNAKPMTSRTKDNQKLESQRTKFLGTCPYCKQPNKFIVGTNVIVCGNENCKGKKITITDEDGTEFVKYLPFMKTLSDKGMEIGNILFND